MRLLIVAAGGVLLVLGSPGNSLACMFNTDCQPGSQCLKSSGSLYGICVGGLRPGNTYDQRPVFSPTDPNRTVGNTCQFDVQCGPGSVCVKGVGQLYGACMRR